MSGDNVEPHARLIAALAETMSNGMWASDIETRCSQIIEAVQQIRSITAKRHSGER